MTNSQEDRLKHDSKASDGRNCGVELILCLRFFSDVNNSYESKLACLCALIDYCETSKREAGEKSDRKEIYYDVLRFALAVTAHSVARSVSNASHRTEAVISMTILCGLIPALLCDVERLSAAARGDAGKVRSAIERLLRDDALDLHQCDQFFKPLNTQQDPFDTKTAGDDAASLNVSTARSLAQSLVLSTSESTADSSHDAICNHLRVQHISELHTTDYLQRAAENNLTLDLVLEQKIVSNDLDYARISQIEFALQKSLSSTIIKLFNQLCNADGIELLGRICYSILESDAIVIRILLTYARPSDVLQPLCSIFDDTELVNTIEDPSISGSIILLCQHIVKHAQRIGADTDHLIPRQHCPFMATYFRSIGAVPNAFSQTNRDDDETIATWIMALFGSEGIPDDLTRSSPPQLLLRITPAIFSQTVQAVSLGYIDLEVVKGGLTYFLQDLLVFTLPSAVRCMLDMIERLSLVKLGLNSSSEVKSAEKKRSICVDLLAGLLMADGCPVSVKDLVADRVRSTLTSIIPTSPTVSAIIDSLTTCGAQFSQDVYQSIDSLVDLPDNVNLAVTPALSRSSVILYDCVSTKIPVDLHSLKLALVDVEVAGRSLEQQRRAVIFAILFGCWRQMRRHTIVTADRARKFDAFDFTVYFDGLLATVDAESGMRIEKDVNSLLDISINALHMIRHKGVAGKGKGPIEDSLLFLSSISPTISKFKCSMKS